MAIICDVIVEIESRGDASLDRAAFRAFLRTVDQYSFSALHVDHVIEDAHCDVEPCIVPWFGYDYQCDDGDIHPAYLPTRSFGVRRWFGVSFVFPQIAANDHLMGVYQVMVDINNDHLKATVTICGVQLPRTGCAKFRALRLPGARHTSLEAWEHLNSD